MKAAVIEQGEAGTSLKVRDVDDPRPGPADVLVAVRAAGLNRADLRRASSHFASSEGSRSAAVGGLEMAGEVIAVGTDVEGFAVGDRVMAMTGGAWAEQVAVDHRLVVRVPSGYSWLEAAATPISFMTSHDALSAAATLSTGQSVLVQGASSSAGIACVQLAPALGAGCVMGTSTTGWKRERLQELGIVALEPDPAALAETVRDLTDGRGADIVIDIIGQGAVQSNIDAAAVGAKIICLGRLAGTQASFNLDEFSRKRIRMIGVTFRTRSIEERIAVVARFASEVIPLLEAGAVKPVIDTSFPLHEVEQAETYMRSSEGFGKVLIDVAAS